MKLEIPVYVQHAKSKDGGPRRYRCAPLFEGQSEVSDVHLERALAKLAKGLKVELDQLGGELRHDRLVRRTYFPEFETRVIKTRLDLVDRSQRARLLLVLTEGLGRRIAFSPAASGVWFEYGADEDLELRAEEVFTHHFRECLREARRGGEAFVMPDLESPSWVTSVELDVARRQQFESGAGELSSLWEGSRMLGGVELHRVGRRLDWLGDSLQQAILREREIHELASALAAQANRPVAIVGPPLCGKTAVLHEHIRRIVAARGKPFSATGGYWLLSPQRLISGMSYVGQWENRLIAILEESQQCRHVLVFDDFLGLFEAGKSSCSHLCVADVLRGYLLRRQVRVVSEFTESEWAAFQEKDRGLADQFHVVRVAATDDDATMRVLIHERRRLEHEHRCMFATDAIPAIWEVHRRYDRGAAFPGKAAGFMQRLAAKNGRGLINADSVYQFFGNATGLWTTLVDSRARLRRSQVVSRIEESVVGQREGVDAATDAIMLAKSGLNDQGKPISTLLFLGPTGVGKTQCAKALASVMFGSSASLLRFDMNEYGAFGAARRLIGSQGGDEGALTAAVRRQPYAVVLLDEIEKAHPDVFDLLLQVLGEGRLTDARGTTTEFTNTVVVMTSNLGVREAGRGIGLWRQDESQSAYLKAVRRRFRPEFFNRIDRIVPFQPLSVDSMRRIADTAIQDVMKRDGLRTRAVGLRVDSDAVELLVRRGYHPQLGARALKRTLEDSVTQPVAQRLATIDTTTSAILHIRRDDDSLTADVHSLSERSPRRVSMQFSPTSALEFAESIAAEVETELRTQRPLGTISAGRIDPEQLAYLALREHLSQTRVACERLREWITGASARERRLPSSTVEPPQIRGWNQEGPVRQTRAERRTGYLIREYLDESRTSRKGTADDRDQWIRSVVNQACLLKAAYSEQREPHSWLLGYRDLVGPSIAVASHIQRRFAMALMELGFDAEVRADPDETPRSPDLLVSGIGVRAIFASEIGVSLIEHENWGLKAFEVCAVPCREGEIERTQREVVRGWNSGGEMRLPSIVRRYQFGRSGFDCGTGMRLEWSANARQHAAWLLNRLAARLISEDEALRSACP